MNFLNELAQAKRQVNVEGYTLYVCDKGIVRTSLAEGEKQEYRVTFKKGIQYVYDKNNKQIQPRKDSKPSKKSTSKL